MLMHPIGSLMPGSKTTKFEAIRMNDNTLPNQNQFYGDAEGFYEQALRQGSVKGKGTLIKPNESSS